jgi:DNA repair photolyase
MTQLEKKKSNIKVTEVECKTALSPSRLPGFDYSLNPYKGCDHGCRYCYAPNILRIPRREWGEFVEVKRNIPRVLAKELKTKKKGTVGISVTTDPYQPLEEKYELTRLCLEQLARFDFPISIITKSPLVTRDLDLLSKFSDAEVGLTITTLNDHERGLLEPKAPSIESRINTLKKCNKNGIITYAFLGPLYPTINEEDLIELVDEIKGAGTSKIMVDRLNLRPGMSSSILDALDKESEKGIWREILFGKNHGYDIIFETLENICSQRGMELEIQGY